MRSIRFAALIVASAVAASLSAGCSEPAPAAAPHDSVSAVNGEAAAALKRDMRKLWTDHVVWTRVYIMEAVGNQPGAQPAADRLLRNQEDIGGAVGKYYGSDAGTKMTSLLKEHIGIAVDIIKTAKAGNKAGQKAAEDRWEQNADQIATFLSKANPNWPKATLSSLMKEHLSTTKDEVVARLKKKWDDDVKAFDRVYDHILTLADALSDGIVKQFPEKFK